jgi:hypothetical protein
VNREPRVRYDIKQGGQKEEKTNTWQRLVDIPQVKQQGTKHEVGGMTAEVDRTLHSHTKKHQHYFLT